MTAIFFPGLDSGPGSTKFTALSEPRVCIEIDYQGMTSNSLEFILRAVDDAASQSSDEVVLVGHSAGALIALYVAGMRSLPVVLINPSFHPSRYCDSGIYDHIRERAFRTMVLGGQCGIALIELGDQVVDQLYNATFLAKYLHVMIWPDGNHRFTRLSEIQRCCNMLINTPIDRSDGC